MHLAVELRDHEAIVRTIVSQVLTAIDWPVGRIALTEVEAANACGVNRHVLRDLRLAGRIPFRRLGRKIVYQRQDLINALQPCESSKGQ
jgi:hypothetical protein